MDDFFTRITMAGVNTLENIEMMENIGAHGVNILHKILDHEMFNNTLEWNEGMQLRGYLKKLDENGKARIRYTRKYGYGRVNCEKSLGLQLIRRGIRHTIAKDKYIDLDIKNCFSTILKNVCENLKIPHDELSDFIDNRDRYFNEVMQFYEVDKEKAKELFNSILNNGKIETWKKTHDVRNKNDLKIIKKFKTENTKIVKKLMELNPDYLKFVDSVRDKKKGNRHGSFIFWYLSEIECRILEKSYFFLKENYGIGNNAVLCNDGIMIFKNHYRNDLLEKLNAHIYKELDMRVDFIEKPMNEFLDLSNISLQKQLANPNEEEYEIPEKEIEIYDQEFTTGLISDYFEQLYENWICVNNRAYYFKVFRWYEDTEENSLLHNFLDNTFFKDLQKYSSKIRASILNSESYSKEKIDKLNIFDKNINKIRNINFRKGLILDILNKIRDDNVEFDKNPDIFCFDNCYYHIQKKAFYIKGKPKMFLKNTCGYPYDFDYSDQRIEELHDLLDTIFNQDVKNYYLSILKTGLIGKLSEHLFIATGRGGNGKSLLNSLMLKTVGNYGYILPSEFLLKSIPTGANPQIANLHKKRFVLSSEPDREKQITASTIKDLTGNTEFNARGLYSSQCKVINNMTLILEANDLPKMSEVNEAIDRRIRIIPFSNLFVGKDKFDKIDEETKKTGVYQANEYFKTTAFQEKYKQALFDILRIEIEEHGDEISAIPKECEKFNKTYLQDSDYIYQFIEENYECDNQGDGYIYLKDIYDLFIDTSYYRNMSKEQKRAMSRKNFIDSISNNLFLRKYYKDRKKYINGTRLDKPALIQWRRKTEQDTN